MRAVLRAILKPILKLVAIILYRVKKVGEENVPKERGIHNMWKSCIWTRRSMPSVVCKEKNIFYGKT